MQQKLKALMGTEAAAFVRFLYGAPVAIALLAVLLARPGEHLPTPTLQFLALAALGGACQIVATNLLIMAFGYRNFAVGTAYSKTEAPQAAVMAYFLLNEGLSVPGWMGILVALVGVMVLSLASSRLTVADLLRDSVQPAALCGIGAGFLFGLTGICFRAASLDLDTGDVLTRAIFTLSVTNTLQILMAGLMLAWRRPEARGVPLGVRQRLLVHRLHPGSRGAGARAGPGGAAVHAGFQPLLPGRTAEAVGHSGCGADRAGRGRGGAGALIGLCN
jgi:drug/metabolite transporter (DMT)-like permease